MQQFTKRKSWSLAGIFHSVSAWKFMKSCSIETNILWNMHWPMCKHLLLNCMHPFAIIYFPAQICRIYNYTKPNQTKLRGALHVSPHSFLHRCIYWVLAAQVVLRHHLAQRSALDACLQTTFGRTAHDASFRSYTCAGFNMCIADSAWDNM